MVVNSSAEMTQIEARTQKRLQVIFNASFFKRGHLDATKCQMSLAYSDGPKIHAKCQACQVLLPEFGGEILGFGLQFGYFLIKCLRRSDQRRSRSVGLRGLK